MEHRALENIATLETELIQVRQERDELIEVKKKADEEVSTLRRVVQHHEQESRNRKSLSDSKLVDGDLSIFNASKFSNEFFSDRSLQ